MALKQNFIIPFGVAAALLVAGCSHEKFSGVLPGDGGVRLLCITVADGGYASGGTDKNGTRAVENGYATEFTAGDACGLYIVRKGEVVYENVKLTATAGTDGTLAWQPEAGVDLTGSYSSATRYFLYYPYRQGTYMEGKTDVAATGSDAGFFAPLISGWTVKTDQSRYAEYTASDLMTAMGTVTKEDNKLLLAFSMTHRMALAVIDMPKTVYTFTNEGLSIPELVIAPVVFTYSAVKPCFMADKMYRYIVNVNGAVADITGIYAEDTKKFVITPSNITSGCYRRYVVDGETPVTYKTHNLQVGDFLFQDGNLFSKDLVSAMTIEQRRRIVGMVFYVGHHAYDRSDYSQSGISLAKCRGYAAAVGDAATSDKKFRWGGGGDLGCYPRDEKGNKINNVTGSQKDWSGYDYTQAIIYKGAGGLERLNASSCYPATYYAVVSYEEKKQAPANSSGWFLPSIGQMKVVRNQSSSGPYSSCSSLLGYWSSSELYSNPMSEALYLNRISGSDYGELESEYKAYPLNSHGSYFSGARSVLAF